MSLRNRDVASAVVLATALAVTACGSSSSSSSSSAAAGGASSTASGSSGSGSTGSGSGSGKLTTMTVAFTPSSNAMAIPIGIKQGFFKQHGIQIKYGTAAATGAEQIAQILNGQHAFGVIVSKSSGISSFKDLDGKALPQFTEYRSHVFELIKSTSHGSDAAARETARAQDAGATAVTS